MTLKVYCTHCNAEVLPADKFCGNCGEKIDWQSANAKGVSVGQQQLEIRCTICGHLNSSEVSYCEACGGLLPTQKTHQRNQSKHSVPQKKSSEKTSSPLIRSLLSWKLTLGLAVVFVVVLLIMESSRNPQAAAHQMQGNVVPEHAQAMLAEIDQLQQRVDANPNDLESAVRLGNLLHDVRFYPRAIAMYQRYLKANPSNSDARVDMGICFFELALTDSTKMDEYLANARSEMQKALTYNPKHQLAHFNLGIVSLRIGDFQEANQWFKKCIDIDPNSETGKRAQDLYNQHQFTNKP